MPSGDRGLDAERGLERRGVRRVRVEQPQRLVPELDRGGRRDAVGGDVQRLERLARGTIAGEPAAVLGRGPARALEEVAPPVVGERAAHPEATSSVRRTVPSIRPEGLSVTTKTRPSFRIPQYERSTAT